MGLLSGGMALFMLGDVSLRWVGMRPSPCVPRAAVALVLGFFGMRRGAQAALAAIAALAVAVIAIDSSWNPAGVDRFFPSDHPSHLTCFVSPSA